MVGSELRYYLNESTKYVSIEPMNALNSDRKHVANKRNNFSKLSATSILFIVLGSIGFIILVAGMWVIFYVIQKDRHIEDRERMAVRINI